MAESAPRPNWAPDDKPREPAHRAGEVVAGKYCLKRLLGTGGFGEVWVAQDQVLDVHVALKLLYPSGGGTQGPRLLREARAAAQLGHPAIVRVFEFGEAAPGAPYMAMELLHGETLWSALETRGRFTPNEAIQTLLPIADALHIAHAKGIVHRDVKPENIFIARDLLGRVQPKLLDFGVAWLDTNLRLTGQGAVLGTPMYMSPEQARGDDVIDVTTDVWAFSVVLYELITGQLPFAGPNYNALLQSIINDTPVPSTEHAAGDASLWTLLETGLAKDPAKRWESMRTMGEALALWAYDHGVREDMCGVSLRSSWLEAEFSDVKMVVGSGPPDAVPVTEPPVGMPEPAPVSNPIPASGPVRFGNTVLIERKPAPRPASRRLVPALVLGLLLLVGLGLALVLYVRSREVVPVADVEGVPATPGPSPVAVAPSPPPPKVEPAPVASADPAPLVGASEMVGTSPASSPSAPATGKPRTLSKPKGRQQGKDIDLGF